MSNELIIAVAGAVTILVTAVGAVIKKVDPMAWWSSHKASAAERQARADDAFGWTRTQLEQERARRDADADSHREEQERLRAKLEAKIERLEEAISIKDRELHAANIGLAKAEEEAAKLIEERDALRAELQTAHETYARIIGEAFAKRVEAEG